MPERVSEVDGKADQTDLYIIVILSFNGDKRAAYWLYNQYRYEVERYADEIAADVLRVGDEEFAERRKMAIGDDTSYIIDRSSRTQSGTSTIRNVQTQLCFDFKTDVLVDSIIGGQLNMTKLNLSFDATLPEDSIIHGVERNVVNYYIPFQVERLDSLLRARLSQYDFRSLFAGRRYIEPFQFLENFTGTSVPALLGELNTGMLRWSGKGDDRSRFPDKPSSEADGGTTDFESVSDPVAAFLLGFAN